MTHFITSIQQNLNFIKGSPTSKDDIINRLIMLQACKFTPPPLEYIEFLIKINGMRSFDANLYGCYELSNDVFVDFLDKNLLLDRTDKKCIIVIGENMMDYLTYNNNEKIYETRDKQTDQITYTFDNLENALSYFFDLEEEQ